MHATAAGGMEMMVWLPLPAQAASPPPPSVGAPIVVVALGGNALLKRGEPLTMEVQQRNAKTAAAAVRQLVDAGYSVCCTHGNGPQVGMLALQDPTVCFFCLTGLGGARCSPS